MKRCGRKGRVGSGKRVEKLVVDVDKVVEFVCNVEGRVIIGEKKQTAQRQNNYCLSRGEGECGSQFRDQGSAALCCGCGQAEEEVVEERRKGLKRGNEDCEALLYSFALSPNPTRRAVSGECNMATHTHVKAKAAPEPAGPPSDCNMTCIELD